uniref:Secreted protein n=1 Tax=Heligmosomoides polygyrus TaxID=6339 RepID=A0A183FVP0_HELPZ
LLCSLVEFFCAVRIHLTLKSSGISSCVKRLQRQMFQVLLLQVSFPRCTISRQFSVVIYVTFLGNFDSIPLVTDCIGVLLSLYPLLNSIVTVFSIADYRIYLISLRILFLFFVVFFCKQYQTKKQSEITIQTVLKSF